MEVIVQILYEISNALLIPDVVGLFLLLAWSMLYLGGIVGEFVDRRQGHRRLRNLVESLKEGQSAGDIVGMIAGLGITRGPAGKFTRAAQRPPIDEVVLGKVVDDIQIELNARVARPALGIRLGPILGLMGTLIPMGPALTGLAGGNVADLASNLVVAFATTVLGLVIGGCCYVVAVVRRRWYSQDLSDIEFLCELAIRQQSAGAPHA